MKKLVIIVLCLLLMSCQNNSTNINDDQSEDQERILYTLDGKVGDYVIFGHYRESPILWQIIDVNENKYTLWSDKIIAFKSFDAASSQKVYYTKNDVLLYDTESDFFNDAYNEASDEEKVEAFGSGRWRDSSLRAWLNAEGQVRYLNIPSSTAVFPGGRSYDNELGFLSNFTASEKSYVQPMTHKTLLSNDQLDSLAGGSEMHEYVWDRSPKNAVLNYDQAYYENLVDQVFLLSLKEVGELVDKQGLKYTKEATEQAKENFETKRLVYKYYESWLRTPYPNRPASVRTVHGNGQASSWITSSDEIGVAPALVITGDDLKHLEGDGSFESPYVIQ